MKKDGTINLLIIGSMQWCDTIKSNISTIKKYHLQSISDFKTALHRLKHNSYDILILEQQCFKYRSLNLSQLSYAMSRPSVILCDSFLKFIIYSIWKKFSNWTNEYKLAKQLIHIKLKRNNPQHLDQYFENLIQQHKQINAISKQIRSNIIKKFFN